LYDFLRNSLVALLDDSENSWISDGLPSSSRRRRRGEGRGEGGEWHQLNLRIESIQKIGLNRAMAKLVAGADNELGGSAPHRCR